MIKEEKKEITEKKFEYRTYIKSELAGLYYPAATSKVSLGMFNRWIRFNKKLQQELTDACYKSSRHSLTPLEVRIIVKYLGEP